MATTKLKNGETVTLPFEEMIEYVSKNKDEIEGVEQKNPTPKRRLNLVTKQKPVI